MIEKRKVIIARPKVELQANRGKIQQESKEIAKALWSGKLTVNEQNALNQVCLLYGLDPILKQVVMLGGNVYITGGGLKVIGNKDPKTAIDGIEVGPANPEERKNYGCVINDSNMPEYQHLFKAIVWKKGCSRPFIEWGESDKNNVKLHNADFKSMADMAKTRAVNRALRNAYDVAFTSIEEMGYPADKIVIDVEPEKAEETKKEEKKESPAEKPTRNDYGDLLKLCDKAKKQIGDSAYYNILFKEFTVIHANQLKTIKDLEKFLEMCRDYYKKENK